MRLYFATIITALAIVTVCGAALSWDGSYFLFKTLDMRTPFAPFGRLTNVPMHWVVLQTNQLTGNLLLTRLVFGMAHAAVPLVALLASWWVVRKEAAPLFLWAALGINLATLPGQFGLTSEGVEVVQLFWPLLLALLLRVPRQQTPLVAAFGCAVFFFHPAAAALFGFGACVALLVGALHPVDRTRMALWACVFAVLAFVRYEMIRTGYETQQLSTATQAQAFRDSLAGLPIVALACVLFAAIMMLAPTISRTPLAPRAVTAMRLSAFAGITAAGALLIPWARDPHLWMGGISFKDWALPVTMPFMIIAVAEGTLGRVQLSYQLRELTSARLGLIQAAGGVFLVVLYLQSRVFVDRSDTLQQVLAQSPLGCISMRSLPALYGSALNNWALPAYAVLLQGREPHTLVLPGDDCAHARLANNVQLISLDQRSDGRGWFDLQPALARIRGTRGCWFSLSPGWYATEENSSGWWRWSSGHGQVRIYTEHAGNAVVFGQIATVARPDLVDISINGVLQHTLRVTPEVFQAFAPLTIPINAGQNVLLFTSHNPAEPRPHDQRLLALAVKNLSLTTDSACVWQP